jgi:hypothetical protein
MLLPWDAYTNGWGLGLKLGIVYGETRRCATVDKSSVLHQEAVCGELRSHCLHVSNPTAADLLNARSATFTDCAHFQSKVKR